MSKGGVVTLEEFHILGLTCLLLANKLTDNYLIPVNHEVFPLKDICSCEEKVCWKLNFRITPITYVDFMDGLLAMWNHFAKVHNLWSYEGYGNKENNNVNRFNARKYFELLDILYLSI